MSTPTVRAKFFVQDIRHSDVPGTDQYAIVKMAPVFGAYGDGDEEANKSWSKWTPSGSLEMAITNPEAIAKFEIGKSYFLDFTPAD